ncbi:hypothetical protein AB5I41_24995 [Sphingomonas sp. MMS24-JH45]
MVKQKTSCGRPRKASFDRMVTDMRQQAFAEVELQRGRAGYLLAIDGDVLGVEQLDHALGNSVSG